MDGTDGIRGDFESLKDAKVIPRFCIPVCPGTDGGAASELSLRRHMWITLPRSSVRLGLRFSGSISNVLIYCGKAGCTGGKVETGTGEHHHWMGWIAGLLCDKAQRQDLWWQYSGSYKTSTVNYTGIHERNGVMGCSLLVRPKPVLVK